MDLPPILPTAPAPTPAPTPQGPSKRHGCLVTWLILMLAIDVIYIIGSLAGPALDSMLGAAAKSANSPLAGMLPPPPPAWVNAATIALCAVDIVAILFIFRWKKWGFYASVGATVLLIMVNVASGAGSVFGSLLSLITPALLYTTLKMGGGNCAWKRLA